MYLMLGQGQGHWGGGDWGGEKQAAAWEHGSELLS